ncbi:hypothetical protein PG994_009604 [Apiospora phragmitis]|uniref:BZIP domain-containing protein n=1 Tax=Apiospora phragmitis TaxID=2905665 RepID=A0ABR1U6K0_9PEZI
MDAEQEQKRRRERGREAQAAFRKRQAKAAKSIQEENKQLREAIESIVQAARKEDRSELVSAVRTAAGTVGMEAKHLELSAADNTAISTDARTDCPNYDPSTHAHNAAIGSALGSVGASKNRVTPPSAWSRLYRPPATIGNFWSCEELWSIMRRSTAHSKSLSRVGPEFWHTMAKAARQRYLQDDRVHGIYLPATECSSLAAMRSMVEKDYASEGKDASAWLLPKDVEERVRRGLGSEMFKRLEKAAQAPESSQAHRAVKGTIHKMVHAFVCFGDGPSWNVNFVDLVFGEWAALETQMLKC